MLAIQSHHLSWRDSLAFGLWQLLEWIAPSRPAQTQPALLTGTLLQKPSPTLARLIIDGVEYVDVGRKFPLRADRLDYYYESADI